MKNYFQNDYSHLELSKYFLLFVDKMCKKLGFYLYYNSRSNKFIVSDKLLDNDYKYYKTREQIKTENITETSKFHDFDWHKKTILLFDKEEPYEKNDGEWYYPDYYEYQHDLDFKMNISNLQKLLLCIFKNPILKEHYYIIQEIFPTYDISIYFPSENLSVNENLDLLLIKNLDKHHLLEKMLKNNSEDTIVKILQKKSSPYLIEFFKSFGKREDLQFKDFIFKVTQNQETLEKIFENFPFYNKFLLKNAPTEFLEKETQNITIFKSFFSIVNLSLKYHENFNEFEISNHLLKIFENHSLKKVMAEKNIIIHNAFHDYSSQSVVSIIENNSLLPIKKIEEFFCEAITHVIFKNGSYPSEQPNLIKFFNYVYQNEISLLNHGYSKNSVHKI